MVLEKKRYIVFTTSGKDYINTKEIEKGIVKKANLELDDWEYSMSIPKMKVVEYYPALRIGIAKVLLSGVESIKRLFEQPVELDRSILFIKIVKISGIIKKAKKWIVEQNAKEKKRNRPF